MSDQVLVTIVANVPGLVAALASLVAAVRAGRAAEDAHVAARQLVPDGGRSARDVLDRLETLSARWLPQRGGGMVPGRRGPEDGSSVAT